MGLADADRGQDIPPDLRLAILDKTVAALQGMGQRLFGQARRTLGRHPLHRQIGQQRTHLAIASASERLPADIDIKASQQQQFQQTASTSSASNYYQQKMNLQQNLMTTQQNAQQKINSLNQQLMKKNMTSAKPMGGVNRQLDSDLSAYQSSCCKEGKRLPALGSGPTSEEDDSQSGEGLCGDLPSTATADQISPMSQAMQGMAPAIMQRVMGNSGGFQ